MFSRGMTVLNETGRLAELWVYRMPGEVECRTHHRQTVHGRQIVHCSCRGVVSFRLFLQASKVAMRAFDRSHFVYRSQVVYGGQFVYCPGGRSRLLALEIGRLL